MFPTAEVPAVSAPPLAATRGWVRWVCTSNPFYVLSAGLFLAGLWLSFGKQVNEVETWALMSGLAGYTLLLAVTACLLVRFGNVWDDVRTVLLLVVLMFMATSVTFDEVLVLNPARGMICYLSGLLLAIGVSEALLRGIRLALPAWFRGPYYLILALFFLYPLALSELQGPGQSEALMWGLFGFAPAAGLVFLTLLPAIRRDPEYVRDNGSPWLWPLYPWTLFGLLALAVPARAFLLCWSMHLLDGPRDQLVFGPYFLVPFGLVLGVLLLEIGLVSGRRLVLALALAVPMGLLALALVGHRSDPIYREFMEIFRARLGALPLFWTLLLSAGFYAYAGLRRVPLATEGLTAMLLALAVIGPDSLRLDELTPPRPAPILLAGALQLALGLCHRSSWRCIVGTGGLAFALALLLPPPGDAAPVGGAIAFHLVLLTMLAVGAVFDDGLARLLRIVGPLLILAVCLLALSVPYYRVPGLPPWTMQVYPLIMAVLLAGFGLLLGRRFELAIAALILLGWAAGIGWRAYVFLRQIITGLDYMALSLTLFALGILISLAKAGLLQRRTEARESQIPNTTD